MNASRLSQICDTALEAGWLLGVTITPVFFNVYSSRVFEPDKLTTLRALAVVLAVFWLVRFIDERLHKEVALRFSLKTPMVLPALLTIGVYLVKFPFLPSALYQPHWLISAASGNLHAVWLSGHIFCYSDVFANARTTQSVNHCSHLKQFTRFSLWHRAAQRIGSIALGRRCDLARSIQYGECDFCGRLSYSHCAPDRIAHCREFSRYFIA